MNAIPLFEDVTDDEQHFLLSNSAWFNVRRFKPKEALVQKGDEATSLFIILQGEALAVITPEIQKPMTTGDVFGEVSYFLPDSRRTASVHAVDDVNVAEMPFTAIDEIARTRPSLARRLVKNMGRIIANRLTVADERARQASKDKTKEPGFMTSLLKALSST